MPKPTRKRSAKNAIPSMNLNQSWSSTSSESDDMDFNYHLEIFLGLGMPSRRSNSRKRPGTKRTPMKRTTRTATATTRAPAAAKQPTPKNTKNMSIISIGDSDEDIALVDESDSKRINADIKGKMDSFFKSGGLLSDEEEDDLICYSASTSTANQPSCSTSRATSSTTPTEDVVEILDDSIQMNAMAQDFCKETSKIIGNASALLDKLTKTDEKVEERPPTPVKINEETKEAGIHQECPVCYESLQSKSIMATKCGHLFCKECIMKVAEMTKKCPLCKKAVNKKNIIPIFI